MRAIVEELAEIDRMQEAIEKTNSEHLKRDYQKAIKRKKKSLRLYCHYRGINYDDLC